MPTNEETLLELLRTHGTMGNGKARELLQWPVAQYEVVKASLVAQGLVRAAEHLRLRGPHV